MNSLIYPLARCLLAMALGAPLLAAKPVFQRVQAFMEDATGPSSELILASDGNFYGTTGRGGLGNASTIYRVSPQGEITTIFKFGATDGEFPSGLTEGPDGALYGTTNWGGSGPIRPRGTAFRLTKAGEFTTLKVFTGPDGVNPAGRLTLGTDGNFYGTTFWTDGEEVDTNRGLYFRMTPQGTMTVLALFDTSNGSNPDSTLVLGADGNFYGTTARGGPGNVATLYRATPAGMITRMAAFNTSGYSSTLAIGSDGNFYGKFTTDFPSTTRVFRATPQGVITYSANLGTDESSKAPLVEGPDGNFYGAISGFGIGESQGCLFKVTPGLAVTVFKAFAGPDGAAPKGGLTVGPDGDFYGTTFGNNLPPSPGTVFKISMAGELTQLAFFGPQDGGQPMGKLLTATDGKLYGTTCRGGRWDQGTVYRTTTNGTRELLFEFDGLNGSQPTTGLCQGADGNFYGTTYRGGSADMGTIFRISSTGTLECLVHFTGVNGATPAAALTLGPDGKFYGTTAEGGAEGRGTIFSVSPGGLLTTLVSLTLQTGWAPHGGITPGSDGNFYGTTSRGPGSGKGSVFRMTAAGVVTTLAGFTGANGTEPGGELLRTPDGDFYGTTSLGGSFAEDSSGGGTVFRITQSGALTTLATFSGIYGSIPQGVTFGPDGKLYGTTYYRNSCVFAMTPAGALEVVARFDGDSGSYPSAALATGPDGHLYGTTLYGGTMPDGTPAGAGQIYRLAFSGPSTNPTEFLFSALDADVNGRLSFTEWCSIYAKVPSRETIFTALDVSGDYSLSLEEISMGLSNRTAAKTLSQAVERTRVFLLVDTTPGNLVTRQEIALMWKPGTAAGTIDSYWSRAGGGAGMDFWQWLHAQTLPSFKTCEQASSLRETRLAVANQLDTDKNSQISFTEFSRLYKPGTKPATIDTAWRAANNTPRGSISPQLMSVGTFVEAAKLPKLTVY
jgi:uncharacterized repeat protein (TIGR03803 family)